MANRRVLHNLGFRTADDRALIIILWAEPIVDTRTYGDREVAEVEAEGLAIEARIGGALCSITQLEA